MHILTHYQGLLFDLDGTLINSMPAHIKAWQLTAQDHGFSIDGDLITRNAGSTSREIAQKIIELGHNIEPISFMQEKNKHFVAQRDLIEALPLLFKLRSYHERGFKIAIATGGKRDNANYFIQKYGLSSYIDALIAQEDVVHGKPHPEVFLKASAALELQPQACLVFEDAQNGLLAAKAAGCACIEVDNNGCKTVLVED